MTVVLGSGTQLLVSPLVLLSPDESHCREALLRRRHRSFTWSQGERRKHAGEGALAGAQKWVSRFTRNQGVQGVLVGGVFSKCPPGGAVERGSVCRLELAASSQS